MRGEAGAGVAMAEAVARATGQRSERWELTARQARAVELLLRGYRDKEVAAALGTARETVTRWRLYDQAFDAELRRRRDELRDTTADRVGALLDLAMDALERELKGERPMPAVTAVLAASRLLEARRLVGTVEESAGETLQRALQVSLTELGRELAEAESA